MQKILIAAIVAFPVLVFTGKSLASETETFTYDEHGRLVKVERSGSVNNNVDTDYEYDDANSRTNEKTTGSPNPPP